MTTRVFYWSGFNLFAWFKYVNKEQHNSKQGCHGLRQNNQPSTELTNCCLSSIHKCQKQQQQQQQK